MGEARSAWMKALPAPFRFAASSAILAVANAQLQDSVRRRFDRAKHAGREVGTGRIRSLHKMPPELLSLAPAQPDALTTDGTFVVDADTMKYALRRCFGYAGPEAGAAVKVDRKHAVRLDAVIDRWQIERPGLSVLKSPSPAVIDLASTMCHRLARRMDATLASDAWLAIRPHEGGIGVDPSKVQTPALRLLVQEAEALGVTARLCVSSKPSAAMYQAARLLSKQLESRLARTPLARDWPWIAFKAPGTNARTSVALVASSIAAAIALRKDHQ
jgi:hypothetical protein